MFDRNGGRKYLNEAERLAFHEVARRESDPLKRTFCLTLLNSGCRISEGLNVIGKNVDSSQKCVVFETLKLRRRGVFRDVPLPDELIAALSELKRETGDKNPLWPFSRATAYRLIVGTMNQAGITGAMASPKGLRHGFAVACVAKGVPLTTIKKWLGHARLETTAIYLDVFGEEERNLARRLWF